MLTGSIQLVDLLHGRLPRPVASVIMPTWLTGRSYPRAVLGVSGPDELVAASGRFNAAILKVIMEVIALCNKSFSLEY